MVSLQGVTSTKSSRSTLTNPLLGDVTNSTQGSRAPVSGLGTLNAKLSGCAQWQCSIQVVLALVLKCFTAGRNHGLLVVVQTAFLQSPVTACCVEITHPVVTLVTNHFLPFNNLSQSPITLPVTNYTFLIVNHTLPVTNHCLPITNHCLPVPNHTFSNWPSHPSSHQSLSANHQSHSSSHQLYSVTNNFFLVTNHTPPIKSLLISAKSFFQSPITITGHKIFFHSQ